LAEEIDAMIALREAAIETERGARLDPTSMPAE
jgi:hypothetical protein